MSRYFSSKETTCRCGCGTNRMSADTLTHADIAREFADTPFVINRGCSCVEHNRNVGGSDESSHLSDDTHECTALDIKAVTSRQRSKILKALILAGFTRIGIAKTFIHADTDKSKAADVFWLY